MIENYIVELLFEQECVIIPGFGGFVINYHPAHYDEKKNIFYPPQHKVGFNVQLKTNDGLLYNTLMKREHISFEQARQKVANYVEKINKRLLKKETVKINNLGSFTLKHQLIFSPDKQVNFLANVYGLDAVLISPAKKIITPPPQRITDVKSSGNYYKWLVAASLLLSILLIPHGFLNFPKYQSQSNLGINFTAKDINAPLDNLLTSYPALSSLSSQIDELSEKKSALNPFTKIKSTAEIVKEIKKETIPSTNKDNSASIKKGLTTETKQPSKKVKPEQNHKDLSSNEIPKYSFCLIIGSFKDKQNAENFFKKKQKDFPKARYFYFNGFYRITSDIFKKKSDASKEMKLLKKKGVSSWIMKY